MITAISASDIPASFFADPCHHLIAQSLLERPRPDSCFYQGPGPAFAVLDPELGFNYHSQDLSQLDPWCEWICQQQPKILAGETSQHYRLLQHLGQFLSEDAPLQILCRYEHQDFCIQNQQLPPLPPSSLRLKQAEAKDLDKLFYFYQRSETMQVRSRDSLLYTIEHNRLFYLHKLGKIVSAALTHCESQTNALIGGVYTPAAYRGKGYGFQCVHALVAALKAEGKTPCLFYEKSNQAARKLYQKLAFTPYGEWVIIELSYQAGTASANATSPEARPET